MADANHSLDGLSPDGERESPDRKEVRATAGSQKARKRGSDATTMTLSISMEDKQRVKTYAAMHAVSVSDLLHSWIVHYCSD